MRALLLMLLGTATLTACGSGNETPVESYAPAEAASDVITEMAEPTAPTAEEIEAETARLNEWFEARWEEFLDFSPMQKSMLGLKEDNDKIDDMSEAAADAKLNWMRNSVAEMQTSFNYDRLTPLAQESYDLWVYNLEEQEAALPFRRQGYTFHQMLGVQSSLPNFLINLHRVDTAEDLDAYIARIAGISRAITQLIERAEFAAENGIHPPAFAYEAVIKEASALITGAPFEGEGDAPLMMDFKAEVATLVEAGTIDEEAAAEYEAKAAEALNEHFKPAYETLTGFAETNLENSPAVNTGLWQFEGGRDHYAERLANQTTTSLTAEEVHEIGLAEVRRIRAEMEAIKEQVEFDGTLQEFFAFVRDDEQFYFPNTDEGRQQYIDTATMHLDKITEELPNFFGVLPKADLVVKRVEPFREKAGAPQHYVPGTPDGSRSGTYYAHLLDMSTMPIPQLEVIAYHEGNPGHHMQLSIAQELEGVPTFRTQGRYIAYLEGWALYSELLAKEMGAYEDPYSDFGRLTTEIWRAIRLVVDTGLHHKEWTEEEAIAYFRENSPAAIGQIKSEIQRYLVLPGQATSYKIGMIKIEELRAKAEAELGEAFDIRGFHDTMLDGGAMPLALLESRINRWIEDEKAAR